jgi:hypothetical protein
MWIACAVQFWGIPVFLRWIPILALPFTAFLFWLRVQLERELHFLDNYNSSG